jgi:hypothetical protein
MEGMSEMHHIMSHMNHVSSNGIVEQLLGLSGRLSARLLIVLTSAALLVVTSIAAGSAVLAQDLTTKPATPQATDKMGMDAGRDGMMGMGADGNGMKGMMSGMQKMKCCSQGMGHSDHGASEKQEEKK